MIPKPRSKHCTVTCPTSTRAARSLEREDQAPLPDPKQGEACPDVPSMALGKNLKKWHLAREEVSEKEDWRWLRQHPVGFTKQSTTSVLITGQ